MAPFFVAELKSRAGKIAVDKTFEKLANTRDRHSSARSKDINWDTEEFKKKKPPPPPPPLSRAANSSASNVVHGRTDSVSSVGDTSESRSPVATSRSPPPLLPTRGKVPPPPTRRGGAQSERSPIVSSPSPTSQSPSAAPAPRASRTIDFANFSEEDKQVFFGWLDEYFARLLGTPVLPQGAQDTTQHVNLGGQKPEDVSAPARTPKPVVAPASGPPPVPVATRPNVPPVIADSDPNTFTTSHPPTAIHGSAALDLANFFSSQTHWDAPWYASTSTFLPPPVQGSQHVMSFSAWETFGNSKTVFGGVLFSDLSVCWFSVKFPTTGTSDPNDTRTVQRSARYLPRPKPMDADALLTAHETYGETIAGFAESFLGTGQFCAQGECWDLADQALKYFAEFDYIPKPVPSLSRTHGHLIFEGNVVGPGGAQVGRWRGGDDRVRRGDVVEWRSVRVTTGQYTWATLGDPDHTAIVVSDTIPRVQVHDGMSITPGEVGALEVIEQSVGQLPQQSRYDMSGMTEGEVWIYRPVGMEAYVGIAELQAKCPEGVGALSI